MLKFSFCALTTKYLGNISRAAGRVPRVEDPRSRRFINANCCAMYSFEANYYRFFENKFGSWSISVKIKRALILRTLE